MVFYILKKYLQGKTPWTHNQNYVHHGYESFTNVPNFVLEKDRYVDWEDTWRTF